MARIRTIKPEAFASESLAEVSVTAERTFFGLLTQADDHGCFRDQPAVIAGLLWSLRPEHGPLEVEDDLGQLASAGLICRYEGEDGKRYLHLVTWHRHQKINRPSGPRYPMCPEHQGGRAPAATKTRPAPATGSGEGGPVSLHGGLREDSPQAPEPSVNHESAGQDGVTEPSVSPHGPDLGPRIRDLGSPPVGGASAPAPQTVSAKQLVGEYVAECTHRPPEGVLGHLGREVAKLIAEGIAPEHIRAGLERLRHKGLHASVLPSLVNEVMNAPQPASGASAHRAWTNPADAEAAYGGEL